MIAQVPAAGTRVQPGTALNLVVSSGPCGQDNTDSSPCPPDQEVVLEDPQLENFIRAKLGVARPNPLTVKDLQKMTLLDVKGVLIGGDESATAYIKTGSVTPVSPNNHSDGNPFLIRSLRGLECATNLTSISFSGNAITDLTPLAGLKKLKCLNLAGGQISDVSPLQELLGLEVLNLADNEISDIAPLTNLKGLRYLNLSRNAVSDLTPLSGLVRLEYLALNGNAVTDISALSQLTALELLFLAGNNIDNIGVLSQLGHLQYLDLEQNPLSGAGCDPLMPLIEGGVKVFTDCRISSDQTPVTPGVSAPSVNLP